MNQFTTECLHSRSAHRSRFVGASMIPTVLVLLQLLPMRLAAKYECDGNTCCDYECYGALGTLLGLHGCT